ncbi:MAG: SDR family oxidoreductase [Candidatus Obscuribacterales bacterium]|jgi:NAD(P)-dependent dehydrogenase (short-subunit alcohol dehydrogenase family)|nr:SDR family oxidoreductase [Candidatus Obscuribacterales bacterium]
MEKNKAGISKGAATIITGASSGIGKALAIDLARKHQARLVLNARGKSELEATAELVKQAGGEAICRTGDVCDQSLTSELIEICLKNYGQLDILVNNAGLTRPGSMSTLTPADWRYVFDVNFFAALNLTYAALPHLQKGAKIVNVASVAGKIAFPGTVCYAASKFALVGFSEGMAAEYVNQGIDVITVCPGWVRTEFFKKNQTPDDPSAIASEEGFRGWLMRNVLSISSEQAAQEIVAAMNLGGSREIVLTAPGLFVERMAGLCPRLTFLLSSMVPSERSKTGANRV